MNVGYYKFKCDGCGQPFEATSDMAGSKAECSVCGCKIIVPQPPVPTRPPEFVAKIRPSGRRVDDDAPRPSLSGEDANFSPMEQTTKREKHVLQEVRKKSEVVTQEVHLKNSPFKRFITPGYCNVIWWFCLGVGMLAVSSAAVISYKAYSPIEGVLDLAIPVITTVFTFLSVLGGLLLLRILLEFIIVVFSINDHLAWIRENTD